jgi:hypothetical protein
MVRDGVANIVYRLLETGHDPRRVGRDAWESRCPAHGSSDHALSITRSESDRVVLDCRSSHRCQNVSILRTLRLGHLYDETPDWLLDRLSGMRIQPAAFTTGGMAENHADATTSACRSVSGKGGAPDAALPLLGGNSVTAAAVTAPAAPEHDASGLLESAIDFSIAATAGRRIKRSAVRLLLRLASRARLFRSADGRFYAQVPVGERQEIYALKSAGFRDWLTDGYVLVDPDPPTDAAVRRAAGVLEARARFNPRIPEIFVRIGREVDAPQHDEPYFLDLGDLSGRAVELSASGWSVVDRPRTHFRRPPGLLPLPTPVRGGSIDLLRPYVNVSDAGFTLLVAWLTAALRSSGPYPILVVSGEQGSAKSTLARVLRHLIDPQSCPLLAEPKSARDLMVTAVNGWLLAYDNLSTVPTWLSDCLCQLVYGGGFASRELFTNDERSVIYAQRPVILNGIDDFVRRGDLRDRCVFVELPPIVPTSRRAEREFWSAFHADAPRILGAVLDTIVGALHSLPSVQLAELPRMADHALWGEAVGRALGWRPEQFLYAYDDNRIEATVTELADSPVASALVRLATSGSLWAGSPAQLHGELATKVGDKVAASARWPKTFAAFGNELRRLAPQLRLHGLSIEFHRRNGKRIVSVALATNAAVVPSFGT